jgi:hypothetical protein
VDLKGRGAFAAFLLFAAIHATAPLLLTTRVTTGPKPTDPGLLVPVGTL